jgi:hypothetical protein
MQKGDRLKILWTEIFIKNIFNLKYLKSFHLNINFILHEGYKILEWNIKTKVRRYEISF